MTRASDRLAFDFQSVRHVDQDGRLHVALSHISKATVNPYYGNEIPGWEALGLDPRRIYQMFRPPEELAKAAPTANNIQLMDLHVAVSADDPQHDRVVGSTGTDAEFTGEHLDNSLVVWDADAIGKVVRGEQKELSCSYRYDAVMTAGTYKGLRYDGKMINIAFNHVALVPEGRAGHDVVVGDSALRERKMPHTSRKALMVHGAICAFIRPLLAQDAKVDFNGALDGVTAATFKAKKPAIIASVTKLTKGKLAADAGLEDMHKLLDSLDDEDDGAEDDEIDADDEDPEGETEEEKAAREKAAAKDKRAKDRRRAKDAESDEEDKAKDKAAMDAAIKTASDRAVADAVANIQAIAEAKRLVFDHVGEVPGTVASAAAVYKLALDHAKVPLDGVPEAAYAAMVGMLPKPDVDAPVSPRLARDARSVNEFAAKCGGAHIRIAS